MNKSVWQNHEQIIYWNAVPWHELFNTSTERNVEIRKKNDNANKCMKSLRQKGTSNKSVTEFIDWTKHNIHTCNKWNQLKEKLNMCNNHRFIKRHQKHRNRSRRCRGSVQVGGQQVHTSMDWTHCRKTCVQQNELTEVHWRQSAGRAAGRGR